MIKLSVNETKWSSLLARTRALILYISIWIFDFGPVKLPGLSRNGPQGAIQRLEDIKRQVEEQTINRKVENRVRPQPQENNEWNS